MQTARMLHQQVLTEASRIQHEITAGILSGHVLIHKSIDFSAQVMNTINERCGYVPHEDMVIYAQCLEIVSGLFSRAVQHGSQSNETQPPHAELPIPQRDQDPLKIDG